MNVGTKSLLFGVHCFFIHPYYVWKGYCKLHGFTLHPAILTACLVHDWGYWGCPNMDGPEGKLHPWLGGQIMHKVFDRTPTKEIQRVPIQYVDKGGALVNGTTILTTYKPKETKWKDFTRFHSKSYAKMFNAEPSKLYAADKLAYVLTPDWLYKLHCLLTGEYKEYLAEWENHTGNKVTFNEWRKHLKNRVLSEEIK